MEEIKEVSTPNNLFKLFKEMDKRKDEPSFYQEGNPFDIVIEVPGHQFCWIRHCMPNFRTSIEKDSRNLEMSIGKGWNPVTVSPNPKLKVNSYGYISHGDVVLCGRITPKLLGGERDKIQDESIKPKRIP